jgi:mannose-6-phosphate isomerase-like protein (cupin superfamily)
MSTRRQELPEPVNLRDKFGLFSDYWSPKIVGELNDSLVKAVKLKGEFVWHHHEAEDELFLVVDGRLRIQFRGGHRDISPGEFIIVPRGLEHCPLTLTDEVQVVLFAPKSHVNTGNVRNERTVAHEGRI